MNVTLLLLVSIICKKISIDAILLLLKIKVKLL